MKKVLKVILIILICIIILIAGGSMYILSKIPYDNLTTALVSNLESTPNFIYSNATEFNQSERTYQNIPEIFDDNYDTINDFEERREEIVELFKTEVYGDIPDYDYETTFDILEEDTNALDGSVTRKQIELTVTTSLGSNSAIILLYTPNDVEQSPTFLALNVNGNVTVHDDKEILPSSSFNLDDKEIDELRGTKADRWPVEDIIASGSAFATIHCDDIAPNDNKDYNTRLIKIFGGDEEEFKTISAWSFGLMKTIDYLVTDENVDSDKIMTVGHSRFGKTSLWTAAQDTRVQVAFANASGTVGSAMSRENKGETVAIINEMFPNWFVDNFEKYSDNENELPLDQHMLLAAIAPRQFYLSNGTDDLWADPLGEYESLKLASTIYELVGFDKALDETMPSYDEPIHNEYFGYHLINQNHNIGYDNWKYYLEYVEKYVK